MANLELEIKLYQLIGPMLLSMAEDLSEEQLVEAWGEGNPPSWIIGHLSIANEFGVASLGGEPELLEKWMPVFGPGSPPTGEHPNKAELVAMFERSSKRFLEAVKSASDEQLSKDRESPILKKELPKVVDMVGHLLTTHLALHVGQLSGWRRANGMASILQIPT